MSNHYVKMPATIATLAAPGVAGLYYVDLDAVVEHPWTIPHVAGLGVDARDRRRHPWQARAATYTRDTLTSV